MAVVGLNGPSKYLAAPLKGWPGQYKLRRVQRCGGVDYVVVLNVDGVMTTGHDGPCLLLLLPGQTSKRPHAEVLILTNYVFEIDIILRSMNVPD